MSRADSQIGKLYPEGYMTSLTLSRQCKLLERTLLTRLSHKLQEASSGKAGSREWREVRSCYCGGLDRNRGPSCARAARDSSELDDSVCTIGSEPVLRAPHAVCSTTNAILFNRHGRHSASEASHTHPSTNPDNQATRHTDNLTTKQALLTTKRPHLTTK